MLLFDPPRRAPHPISYLSISQHFQAMFPAIMPLPMTLAPTKKLSGVKTVQNKNLIRKKVTIVIWEIIKM